MLERAHGRQTPEQLAALMARVMGLAVNSDCSTAATLTSPLPGFVHLLDRMDLARRWPTVTTSRRRAVNPTRRAPMVGFG